MLFQITKCQIKKYIDDELHKNTVLKYNQTLQNYLKVSVGNDVCNLFKIKNKNNRYSNYQLFVKSRICIAKWKITCNDKNNFGKIRNLIRLTKTNSPSSNSGATSLPLIGDSSCIWKQVQTIMDQIMFSSAGRELTSFRLLI